MKTIYYIIFTSLSVLLLASCGGNNDQSAANGAGTAKDLIPEALPATDPQTTDLDFSLELSELANNDKRSKFLGIAADVTSVFVDVEDASNVIIVENYPLIKNGRRWEAQLKDLPVGQALTFHISAFNVSGQEIFSGKALKTLAKNEAFEKLFVRLDPIDDGEAIYLPQIKSIERPSRMYIGTDSDITIVFSGPVGKTLNYSVTSDMGVLSDNTGSGVLNGDFQITVPYTSPEVGGTANFTVHVSTNDGYSSTTTFDIVIDATKTLDDLTVHFNPVVLGLNGQRVDDELTLTAEVTDDSNPNLILFKWSFDGGLSFKNKKSNPAVLEGYDETTTGVITLTITDATGGETTISYDMPAGQFPNSVLVDTHFQALEWSQKENVTESAAADWSNFLDSQSGLTVEDAKLIASDNENIGYFIIVKAPLDLGDKGSFSAGDVIFFSGVKAPSYVDAKDVADSYEKRFVSWVKTPSVIQFGRSWQGYVETVSSTSVEDSLVKANEDAQIKFFFFANETVTPTGQATYNPNDAVFFSSGSWDQLVPVGRGDKYSKAFTAPWTLD